MGPVKTEGCGGTGYKKGGGGGSFTPAYSCGGRGGVRVRNVHATQMILPMKHLVFFVPRIRYFGGHTQMLCTFFFSNRVWLVGIK